MVDVKWESRAGSAEGTFGDPCHEMPAEPGSSDRVSWLIRGCYGMSLPSVILPSQAQGGGPATSPRRSMPTIRRGRSICWTTPAGGPGGDGIREKGGQRLSFTTMVKNVDRTLEQVLVTWGSCPAACRAPSMPGKPQGLNGDESGTPGFDRQSSYDTQGIRLNPMDTPRLAAGRLHFRDESPALSCILNSWSGPGDGPSQTTNGCGGSGRHGLWAGTRIQIKPAWLGALRSRAGGMLEPRSRITDES